MNSKNGIQNFEIANDCKMHKLNINHAQPLLPLLYLSNWVAVRRTYVFTLQEVEKNLLDIAKSRDTSMNNKKQNSFLF